MLKKVVLALGVAIVVLLVLISTRPDTFRVERSAEMAAPPAVVYGFVADFHKWPLWSPWEKLDPGMKKTFAGPAAAVGSVYAWSSDKKDVGEGRMTITEAQPGERVVIKLEFLRPWQATNTTIFTFTPKAGGSHVSWAMEGHMNFMFKAMGLFMNMEKMVGPDFERGLASMKSVAEDEARKLAAAQAAAAAAPQP